MYRGLIQSHKELIYGYIRLYRGYIGIMEKKMETTIKGLGFRASWMSEASVIKIALCLMCLSSRTTWVLLYKP